MFVASLRLKLYDSHAKKSLLSVIFPKLRFSARWLKNPWFQITHLPVEDIRSAGDSPH